jgi:hypothetical protein
MSKVWYKNLGFHSNPFSIKPAAFHDRLFGYNKVIDDISYGILNKKVIVVQGNYGNGKSSILRRLIHDFGGKKQVIYYSCNRIDQRLDVKELLNGRYGFFGRLFDMKPKDMILLLDEAQDLGPKDFEKLYSYYQEGFFKSIVFVGQGIDKELIPKEFEPQLDEVSVGEVDTSTAVQVVRKRIGDIPLLSDIMIQTLFEKSNKNIRLLLKNCEEACRYAVNYGRETVTNDVIEAIFGDTSSKEEVEEKKPEVEEKKPEVEEKNPEPKVEEKKENKSSAKGTKKKVIKKIVKKIVKKDKEKNPSKPKKEVEKVVAKANKKSTAKKKEVYDPERYKDMMHTSAEELLDKGTDEIFSDEQYY